MRNCGSRAPGVPSRRRPTPSASRAQTASPKSRRASVLRPRRSVPSLQEAPRLDFPHTHTHTPSARHSRVSDSNRTILPFARPRPSTRSRLLRCGSRPIPKARHTHTSPDRPDHQGAISRGAFGRCHPPLRHEQSIFVSSHVVGACRASAARSVGFSSRRGFQSQLEASSKPARSQLEASSKPRRLEPLDAYPYLTCGAITLMRSYMPWSNQI